ncbi:MAG TPA: CvpA family protein [Bryobacteraceae bacterium]|jgi:membrane protein required for colicin V production
MWPPNWFDIVLCFLILLSAIAGLRTGFARVVIGLVATVAGFLAGFWCYHLVAGQLIAWTHINPRPANLLGFLIVFVGVLIVGSLLATLLAKLFRWIGLSWFDHLLGGVAGFVRGVLIVAVLADIVVAFAPSPLPAFLRSSRVLPYASELGVAIAQLAPRELKDLFNEQMDNLKQLWATPQAQHIRDV